MREDRGGKRGGVGETVDVHARFPGDIFCEDLENVGVCLSSVD